jgi:hypothetical protein
MAQLAFNDIAKYIKFPVVEYQIELVTQKETILLL